MRSQKSEAAVRFENWMAGKFHIQLQKKLKIFQTKEPKTRVSMVQEGVQKSKIRKPSPKRRSLIKVDNEKNSSDHDSQRMEE